MKDNPFLPYRPLAPAMLGISIMSYLLWKYFVMLGKTRKRYRRAHQLRGPSLEEQIVDHVDQADGPREYILVKERKPRSTPIKRKKERSRGRRMIIDIHLEVLDECEKGDLHSTKEDFFEILVLAFMGSEFMKGENVPKEQVLSSDSGFREEDFLPKEHVPSSGLEELWKRIQKWIKEFLGKMNSRENDQMGTTGCNMVYKDKTEITQWEKDMCVYILGNLWKIKEKKDGDEDRNEMNGKMREYVQCTIMNMWLFIYQNIYCEMTNVMRSAYEAMQNLNTIFDVGQRKEYIKCEYEEFTTMKVGGNNILEHIFNKTFTQGRLMGKIKEMNPGDYCDKIWKDIKNVLDDMLKNVKNDADEIKKLCDNYGEGSSNTTAKNRGKELCKILTKIIYWIDGLKEVNKGGGKYQWERRTDIKNQDDWEFTSMLRCILGKITIAKMFLTHCDMDNVAPIVIKAIEENIKKKGVEAEHEKCEEINFKGLNIGGKFLWSEMDDWIDKGTGERGRVKDIKEKGQHCRGGNLNVKGSKVVKGDRKDTYFGMLRKGRRLHRRAYQVRGPTIQEQLLAHVDQRGPREYILEKERKPRRRPRRLPGRKPVSCRMIIDIHLEVLDECQKGDLHSTKEDFFEILVQEFMGSEFMKEENVSNEQVASSYSGFKEEDFVPKEDVPLEQVPSSDSGFREGRLCSAGRCS
ncbi:SICA antigen [Plasmodium coatneyi]|uniref:SICA antigen n=1 Tax=Plasmodium coatneyi TaxID=208452 RepID=A0A1B1E6S9_9APIC|nr:SICA antigen [Plasmodium coatneyi]ANQ10469.1 SICA antigen [Plasmodium coatneyi]